MRHQTYMYPVKAIQNNFMLTSFDSTFLSPAKQLTLLSLFIDNNRILYSINTL